MEGKQFTTIREFFEQLGIAPLDGGWQKTSNCRAENDDDEDPIYTGENLLIYFDDRWMNNDKGDTKNEL